MTDVAVAAATRGSEAFVSRLVIDRFICPQSEAGSPDYAILCSGKHQDLFQKRQCSVIERLAAFPDTHFEEPPRFQLQDGQLRQQAPGIVSGCRTEPMHLLTHEG
jgi:hypothetical protein